MKTLSHYIKEKLVINKDYSDGKIAVKSFDELRNIIEDRYEKLGPGTKDNPIDFNDVDVSNIDSFCNKYDTGIFEYTKFKYIDISEWDVSNATNMTRMFCWCKELESVGDISKWDVSNVTNMCSMFDECKSFNQDLSCLNVSNVIYKDNIFYNCPIKDEYKPKFK